MPPTHGGRFASTSGDPASHLSDSTAAHAAAVVQMHEQQQRAQMQQGHYAGAYPYAAFVQYNMVCGIFGGVVLRLLCVLGCHSCVPE